VADVYIKKGDRSPSVTATLKAANGVINLTGSTVKFIMRERRSAAGSPKVNAACVVVTPSAGVVRYDWAAADTDTAGHYDAEFEITTAGGNKITCPNGKYLDVLILEDIA
jgi:hypothetical protein